MELTKKEVNKIFKKVQLQFYKYHRYVFTFFAGHSPEIDDPGYIIYASRGGDSNSIHGMLVKHHEKVPFNCVEHWSTVVVKGVSKGGATWDVFNYRAPY